MLRPATPLSILFLAAFALLLLSTLSTPIIQGIPLATYKGVNFGVFGYCENGKCRGPMIGYDTDSLFGSAPASDFSLPSAARHSLSSILIVHPIAAFMTLICFSLAVAAHFHSPAHSPRYLLALLIFTFPTLLVSLLAFLVDILLFVPHMAWGGWIVLAATIIIVASGVVTCAMRRTLVSRKARKRRIAENVEMNGQNYYESRAVPPPSEIFPKAESPPPMSSDGIMSRDKGFTSFEVQKQGTQDDMIPLNNRNPSLKTVSSSRTDGGERQQMMNQPRGPPGGRQAVDQYGNPIPPMPNDPYVMHNQMRGPPPNRGGPRGRGRGGYAPRGGYGPPRGGSGPPRGGPGPRGGYGPPRGGMGMGGPPPPVWNGNGTGMPPPGPMPGPGPMGRGAPPGYNNEYGGQGMPMRREISPYNQQRDPSPNAQMQPSVQPSMQPPMPYGQAIEMEQRGGTSEDNPNYGLSESDGDVQGMLALQQGGGFPSQSPQRNQNWPLSPTSQYSQPEEQHGAAPAVWAQKGSNPSDQTIQANSSGSRGLSPIQASPVELPTQLSTVGVSKNDRSSDYYEDVDPQFAEPRHAPVPMPSSLMPGGLNPNMNGSNPSLHSGDPNLMRNSSFEDIPDGSRSPAASEASHFTSVSQRGINPKWRPPQGPPMPAPYGPYGARRPIRPEDVILEANAANPDFALPSSEFKRGRGRGRGRGGAGRSAIPSSTVMGNMGLGNQGRYPGANAV